ncbi:hypothetical protein D3C87_1223780 [compost metagenome]
MLLANVEQQSPMTDGHSFGLPCSATAIDYEGRLLGCNGRALTYFGRTSRYDLAPVDGSFYAGELTTQASMSYPINQ